MAWNFCGRARKKKVASERKRERKREQSWKFTQKPAKRKLYSFLGLCFFVFLLNL